MTGWPEHIAAETVHSRSGDLAHRLRYSVDYVMIDPEAKDGPALFSRNRFNLFSVHDRDHGGRRRQGQGVGWVRRALSQHGCPGAKDVDIRLLTQPRCLGYGFNPVSFWLAFDGHDLLAVIAEVNNTMGDRHSYFCALPDFRPITPKDRIHADKALHVSPFLDVSGSYGFAFDFRPERFSILIAYRDGKVGLHATLAGRRRRMTVRSLLGASIRRPFGALRTITLIHWQALKLRLKGAAFHTRPEPPEEEVSKCTF